MAGIYLLKCGPANIRRDFHLGDKSLSEIVGRFGIRPEDCESRMPEYIEADDFLFVIVFVQEEETDGTEFQAGYYRAAIATHHAMRQCGIGLSDILGSPRETLGHLPAT